MYKKMKDGSGKKGVQKFSDPKDSRTKVKEIMPKVKSMKKTKAKDVMKLKDGGMACGGRAARQARQRSV